MKKILCVGLATLDTLVQGVSSDLMEVDGTTASAFETSTGGDALNNAVHLASLGIDTYLVCCLGNDLAAKTIQTDLNQYGIHTEWITQTDKAQTSTPLVLIDKQNERHLLRMPTNANHLLSEEMVTDEMLRQVDHLHIGSINVLTSLDGAPLARLLKRAHEFGLTTSIDAKYDKSGKYKEKAQDVLEECDIFIPSFDEAKMYAQSDSIDDILSFFSKHPFQYFGVKLGKEGVILTDFHETITIPSFCDTQVVDTTGAGDAFMGGFLAGYLKGYDLETCGAIASAQSSSVLTSIGAHKKPYQWDENIAMVLKKNYSLKKRD